jgi:hypothetical protein
MGRIFAQLKLTNYTDPQKALAVSALVDTGAAYITLPSVWRESLGQLEQLAELQVMLGDQSLKTGVLCGPIRARIAEFRPILAEVLFLDMQPDEDGQYEALVGYIALTQAGAAVDMLGQRLLHVRHVDLK